MYVPSHLVYHRSQWLIEDEYQCRNDLSGTLFWQPGIHSIQANCFKHIYM